MLSANAPQAEAQQHLFGENQLVIAGMAQPVETVAMLDQHLALPLEQGLTVDDALYWQDTDRTFTQVQRLRA